MHYMAFRKDQDIQGSSPRVFGQVGVLLSRPDIGGGWLSGHPDRADLFKEAFSCVVRLQSHTGWSGDLVLDHLGCDTKTEEELSGLTEQRLRSCIGYMRWVESLLAPLDLALDKRLAVQGAAHFFVAAKRDLPRVEAAMDEGGFSPVQYLRIGEVAKAWETAFSLIDSSEGDRIRHLREGNPFVDESTPHLSPSRLEMLGGPNATELLGARIEIRMREHLDYCPVCAVTNRRAEASLADDRLIGTP
jgi:hypothetical protein